MINVIWCFQLDLEELRPIVLEYIKENKEENLQIISMISGIIIKCLEKGLYLVGPQGIDWDKRKPNQKRFQKDRDKIRQIIWEFIIQGILMPGVEEFRPSLPWMQVTDYGKWVVEQREILPYDPEGYLSNLKSEIQNLDNLIEKYVIESLKAYRMNLPFSSAVTLGVASEKAFILLHEALTNAITSDLTKQKIFADLQKSIRTKYKFDQVNAEILNIKNYLPRLLQENLESNLQGIFHLIRVTRNDAGHPTGTRITRNDVFVNLQLFIPYCKTVYGLINWLQSNTI